MPAKVGGVLLFEFIRENIYSFRLRRRSIWPLENVTLKLKRNKNLVIQDQIGKGQSAHVWRASDDSLERTVAVKFIQKSNEYAINHARTLAPIFPPKRCYCFQPGINDESRYSK